MRFYPHDQDTGGFFVTVLEKKADSPLEDVKPGETAGASATVADDVTMDPHEAEPIEEQPYVATMCPASRFGKRTLNLLLRPQYCPCRRLDR
jgi:hypothetical protein